ncbi:MAG: Uma2 family endonuclease [Gemmataceae bacterium]
MATRTTRPAPAASQLLLSVDWRTYGRLLKVFEEKPRVRMTYDRGRLEIMSPLLVHDNDADFLGQCVVALTNLQKRPRLSGGSVTLRRRSLRRGLEPDRCYWIQNEPLVRGKKRIDLKVDPAPDIVIEVDVTSRTLNKMPIYAAFGVPEVWRLSDGILVFLGLRAGQYVPVPTSLAFPFLTPADLASALSMRSSHNETEAALRFIAWAEQKLASAP